MIHSRPCRDTLIGVKRNTSNLSIHLKRGKKFTISLTLFNTDSPPEFQDLTWSFFSPERALRSLRKWKDIWWVWKNAERYSSRGILLVGKKGEIGVTIEGSGGEEVKSTPHLLPESSWRAEPEWSPLLSVVQTPALDRKWQHTHTQEVHPTKDREQTNKNKNGHEKQNHTKDRKSHKTKQQKSCMQIMGLRNACSRGSW